MFLIVYEERNPQKRCVMLHPMAAPVVSLVAGILILIFPQILNYIVAIYLIVVGILGVIASM